MVAIGILTVAEVLRRGLDLLRIPYRRDVNQSTTVAEFRSLYGSSPSVIATVWADLITTEIDDARLDAADMTDKGFRSFMIAHYFCKVSRRPSLNESLTNIFAKMYPANAKSVGQAFGLAKDFGQGDRVWKWIGKVAALLPTKIYWDDSLDDPSGPTVIVTVDGKDQKRHEVQHPRYNKDRRYCSHKCATAALKWELAVAIHRQQIVHIGGPFRGGLHDSSIYNGDLSEVDYELFSKVGISGPYYPLERKIENGKLGVADSAYAGYKKLMLYGGDDSEELAKFKTRAKLRHETVNGRLCKFQIVNGTFRHSEAKQHIAFLAVAVLVQYELDESAPLFDV